MDEFPITMLANQNVRFGPSVREGKHQLPSMPEGNDNVRSLLVEIIHNLCPFRPDTEKLPQKPDEAGSDGGEHGQLQPVRHLE